MQHKKSVVIVKVLTLSSLVGLKIERNPIEFHVSTQLGYTDKTYGPQK